MENKTNFKQALKRNVIPEIKNTEYNCPKYCWGGNVLTNKDKAILFRSRKKNNKK